MEPEVRAFLQRIMLSGFIGFMWLTLNSTFGIMFDFAFFYDKISVGNIIFYLWFIASTVLMLRLIIKLWKKPAE
ncbi:MAG TPA: hypothetical protein PKM63_18850 [Panacibacter sp.]|nr:hypothetical protein [Panacibacter sp.]HNP46361.1 hypothetical protein [Panacibacter sp.]